MRILFISLRREYFARPIELLGIRYRAHTFSSCRMYTLLWIPFDLRACLLCYANKAAFAIGPALASRFQFGAFLSNGSKYFLFVRKKKNKKEETFDGEWSALLSSHG